MSDRAQTIFLIGLLIFVVSAWIWPYAMAIQLEWEARKKRGDPPDYDERQKLARLQAGNHALYALLGFLLLWVIVEEIGWFAWTGYIFDMVLCAVLLAWCVWTAECIWNDAFVSWKHKQSSNIYALTVLTVMLNITNAFRSSSIIKSILPFIVCLTDMLVLLVIIIYKWRKEKRMKGEENAL